MISHLFRGIKTLPISLISSRDCIDIVIISLALLLCYLIKNLQNKPNTKDLLNFNSVRWFAYYSIALFIVVCGKFGAYSEFIYGRF